MTKENIGLKWEYAPSPEATDHAKINKQYELFINGKFTKPNSKKYYNTINPATEEVIARVADANEKDVDLAITSAKTAYDKYWKKTFWS
jgi:aldehyde dehydrogenase (NAD+)